MFEPSWFIAGNVAVSRMNGFEDTGMFATYAEEGDVCELTMIVGVNSISNKNRRPTSTFFLSISIISIILRSAIRLKNLNSCLRGTRWRESQTLTRFFNFVQMKPEEGEEKEEKVRNAI